MIFLSYDKKMKEKFIQLLRKTNREGIEDLINFIEENKEKIQKLQELYDILVKNSDIKEYFDLEVKFNVMIADINKIIAESIKDVLI